jgi:hypothetical protein
MMRTDMSILVAVSQSGRRRLASILEGSDIAFAASFGDVAAQLRQRNFDLVIVGTHFEQSTAFDVLRYALENAHCRVACVQAVPFSHGLGKPTFDAFKSACTALGASLVLDLLEFPDNKTGNAQIRALVDEQIRAPLPDAPAYDAGRRPTG